MDSPAPEGHTERETAGRIPTAGAVSNAITPPINGNN